MYVAIHATLGVFVWRFMAIHVNSCHHVCGNSCQFMSPGMLKFMPIMAIHGDSWQFMPSNTLVCIRLCGISCRVWIVGYYTERVNPWHFVPTAPYGT